MTVSAHDVAAALRAEMPGLPALKLHKLLYYCQGHHLAHTGRPLFRESISAWDRGPVVGALWHAERSDETPEELRQLTNGELNTVGYVISRYGHLSGLDLQHLTHAEDPWLLADRDRPSGGSARIEQEWMRDYFRAVAAVHEDDEFWIAPEKIVELTAGADRRRAEFGPPGPDETTRLEARLAELRARSGA
jgi:uncharacterized phage-associated protein